VCQWQFSRVLISVLVAVRRQTKKPATVDRRLFGGFSPLSLFTALAFHHFSHFTFDSEGQPGIVVMQMERTERKSIN